jgi:hypothetical protein
LKGCSPNDVVDQSGHPVYSDMFSYSRGEFRLHSLSSGMDVADGLDELIGGSLLRR